jgi:hypothetical protein
MDFNNLTYNELKKLAKEKGIKSFGIKKDALIEMLKKTEAEVSEPLKESASLNEADVVFQDGTVRRRFSLKENGENYIGLAESYAKNKGLQTRIR